METSNHNKHTADVPADPDLLRLAMRRFASGVTIVTAGTGDQRTGITVSAFSSISLDPPVVMVAINSESSAAPVILQSEHFAVHILSHEQEILSERFAQSIPWDEKILGINWHAGQSGAPILEGPATVVDTILIQSVVIGTHTIMFGRVVDITMPPETPRTPLLYYDQNYRTLDKKV